VIFRVNILAHKVGHYWGTVAEAVGHGEAFQAVAAMKRLNARNEFRVVD
jgi:hypothetical protein